MQNWANDDQPNVEDPQLSWLLTVFLTVSQPLCRGGIPICFPNFGPHLNLPTDGFLSDCHWSVAQTAQSPPLGVDRAPQVTLVAESDEDTLQMWPHQFSASYTVSSAAVLQDKCT